MKEEIYKRNMALVSANSHKSITLYKTKIDRLQGYMLLGRPVTGLHMITKFNICSYRDAIYNLKKKGLDIECKIVHKNGIPHRIWWLSEFDEEFVMSRMESIPMAY